MEKNININVTANTTGVKSLKQELRETIQALQQAEMGSAQFDVLSQKAAGLKDKMAEVNEQVNALASGSKYELVSKSLGEIGAGLRDMDFDRVSSGAQLFAKSAKAITFKDAIGSIKQMGSAFLTVGKAILTNPMFLIVGVVVAIIAGIVKLMDKLGILKKIFDFVGGAIDAVVQGIKDFLDWIGLTSFAAEDAAAKQAEAQEKIASSHSDKRDKVVDAYDQEIKLAKIAGESTVEAEKQKQYAIIETSQAEYQALKAQMDRMRVAGTLTKEKADELKKAMTDLRTGINEARQEVESINAQEKADNKAKNETIAKDNEAAAKDQAAKAKQYAADRLAAQRTIQDYNISLMKDGIEKEYAINEEKYKRLIEDTKRNEKLLASEKKAITAQLEQQAVIDKKEIDKKFADKKLEEDTKANEERIALENSQYELQQSLIQDQRTKELEDLIASYDEKYAIAAGNAELEKALAEQQKKDIADINTKFQEEKIAKDKEIADKELEEAKKVAEAKLSIQKSVFDGIASLGSIFINDQKKMEKFNKAFALVQIGIDTAMAISALVKASNQNAANGVTMGAAGIAQFASGIAMILANIAKAKQILTSGGSASVSAGGGGGGGDMSGGVPQSVTPATPNVSLFGQGNNANNLSSSQPMVVQAFVSETEITTTQNRMASIRNMATL